MNRLPIHTIESAPEAARARLEAAQKANGFLPNLLGVLANAPETLAFYQEVGKLNAATSLTAAEREVVQLITARHNGCDFCIAGHTKLATLKKLLSAQNMAAARAMDSAAFDDARLAALATFTLAVLIHRGAVTDAALQAFIAAGFTQQQALEVVLGVALATLSNYANNLAQTEINPELREFA